MLLNKNLIKLIQATFFISLLLSPHYASALELADIEFEPRFHLSSAYDDNIGYERSDTKKDWITYVSPGLTAAYEAEHTSWTADFEVTREMFAKYNDFDCTAENLKFNISQEISRRDRIQLYETFSHSYEPANIQAAFGRTLGRYSYYTNDIVVEYVRDISRSRQLTAFYANGINDFGQENSDDSSIHTAGCELRQAFSSARSGRLHYEYCLRDFRKTPEVKRHRLYAGGRQYLTKQLYLDADIGLDQLTACTGSDYTRPYFRFSLTDSVNDRADVSLALTKEYSMCPYTEDLFDNWEVSSRLSWTPWKRTGFTLTGFYGEGSYLISAIEERLAGTEATIFHELKENIILHLTYSYSRVSSSDDEREYEKNRILLGVKYLF